MQSVVEHNGRLWIASTPVSANEFYGVSVPEMITEDELTQSRDRESFYNGGTR
jgi:hypothetical protein